MFARRKVRVCRLGKTRNTDSKKKNSYIEEGMRVSAGHFKCLTMIGCSRFSMEFNEREDTMQLWVYIRVSMGTVLSFRILVLGYKYEAYIWSYGV